MAMDSMMTATVTVAGACERQAPYLALDRAKICAQDFIAKADTSNGSVTQEIVQFHLVPDLRKAFNNWAKENGCTAIAKSRQLTRQEQDKVNKTRKSLMHYTSLTVSPAAQATYLAKHPQKASAAPPIPAAAAGPAPKVMKKGVLGDKKRGANEMLGPKDEPAAKKPKG